MENENKVNLAEYIFNTLSSVDTKAEEKEKNNLTYLSWARAWKLLMTKFPTATYEVHLWDTPDGKRFYMRDPELGYMVMTSVTIEGITRSMQLPVMDYRVKAVQVGNANMMDVNKAIMRCLTKNIAMFGLGLHLYADEDLPLGKKEAEEEEKDRVEQKMNAELKKKGNTTYIDKAKINMMLNMCKDDKVDSAKLLASFKVEDFEHMTINQWQNAMQHWDSVKSTCGIDEV